MNNWTRIINDIGNDLLEQNYLVVFFDINIKKQCFDVTFKSSSLLNIFKGIDISDYNIEDVYAEAGRRIFNIFNEGRNVQAKFKFKNKKDDLITLEIYPKHGLKL